MTNLAWFTWK